MIGVIKLTLETVTYCDGPIFVLIYVYDQVL